VGVSPTATPVTDHHNGVVAGRSETGRRPDWAVLDWRELDPQRLAGYWLAKVANGIEDYYAGDGESGGEWFGRGATALGLDGTINGNDLTEVLRSEYGELVTMSRRVGPGVSPYSGGTRTVRRRPGWDFCMRAPKSVSLLYAFGELAVREDVIAAHDEAVKAALLYAECKLTRTRRTVDGERRHVPGDGLICALFRHRTSRAGDPQLHTHALIVNATRDDRERWLRLNAPWLLGPSKTLGYIYQAKLRAELTRRLEVEWEPVHRGYADVRGISRRTIEAFSRRRQEILEYLDERGQDPEQAKAAQLAAYETRRAKDRSLAPMVIREEWDRYGREVGLDRGEIKSVIGRQANARPGAAPELRRIARGLTTGQGIVRQGSSATEHEIVRAVCSRLADGGDLDSIEACADLVRSSEELVRLDSPDREERLTELRPEGARYTTRRILAAEREVIEAAEVGERAGIGIASHGTLERVLADPRWSTTLNPAQKHMVRALAMQGRRLSVVRGDAGTGKTFALGAYREAMEAAGWHVAGAASTRRAAAELGEVGIAATSIAATLGDIQRFGPAGFRPGTILVVDEAGTASTWDLRALLRAVLDAKGKLVLVGDPRQLGAVGPGGVFRSLLERIPSIELTDAIRQELATDREAIAAQKADRFGVALGIYAANGRVQVCDSPGLTRAAVVEGWARDHDPERSLMLARANQEVAFLNRAARARLDELGLLTGPALEVADQPFQRADIVVTRAPGYPLGVRNQDRWRVLAVDSSAGVLEVERLSDRHRARLDQAYLNSTGWHGAPAIQHGYAGTIAIAQGATVERVHLLLDGGLDARDIYTATTRSRAETRLYLTDARVRGRSEVQPEPPHDVADPYDDVIRGVDRTRPDFAIHEERYRQEARRMSDPELRCRVRTLACSDPVAGEARAELAAFTEEVIVRERAELAAARRLQQPWILDSIGPLPEEPAERRDWERQLADLVAGRRRLPGRDSERVSRRPIRQAAAELDL
jgi:conjugative relaxase-like TrwC/TraI family protein